MRALGDLVQTGKVRYLGFSDAPAKMSLSRGGTIGTDGLQECPINAYQSGQNWNAESTVILHINVCTIVGHCTKLWPLWHVRGNRKYFGQLACEIAMVSAEYLAATTALIWVRIPLYRAYKQPSLLGHWSGTRGAGFEAIQEDLDSITYHCPLRGTAVVAMGSSSLERTLKSTDSLGMPKMVEICPAYP